MGWFKSILAETPSDAPKEGKRLASPQGVIEIIGEALRAHEGELQEALTSERRQKIFSVWHRAIDEKAHDYADLMLKYPDREKIMKLEVDTFMQAYLNGYMASRRWIDQIVASQSAFLLGRGLRDQLRGLGISLDGLCANLGTVMDKALLDIVQLGLEADK